MTRVIFFLLAIIFSTLSFAQNFVPDNGFALNGSFVDQTTGRSRSFDMTAVQSDGKILVAGYDYEDNGDLDYRTYVRRLNADGSPDGSFGDNGVVRILLEEKNSPVAIGLQADGKIVIAGNETVMEEIPGNPPSVNIWSRPFVLRLTANGSIDPAFGDNGVRHFPELLGYASVSSMALYPDGNIILGGGYNVDVAQGMLYALTANGTNNSSFGNGGSVMLTAETGRDLIVNAVAVTTDQKVIFAGGSGNGSLVGFPDMKMMVGRLQSNGQIDNSFATNGYFLSKISDDTVGTADIAYSIQLLQSGSIAIAGAARAGLGLLKLDGNGSRDMQFGSNGKSTFPAHPVATGLTVLNNKWYVCGMLPTDNFQLAASVIAIQSNGTLDSAMGTDGQLLIDTYERNYMHHINSYQNMLLLSGGLHDNDQYGAILYRLKEDGNTAIVEEPSLYNIEVFPNPVEQELNIRGAKAGRETECTIYDAAGRLLVQGTFRGATRISTANWSSGLYFVQLRSEKELHHIKIRK